MNIKLFYGRSNLNTSQVYFRLYANFWVFSMPKISIAVGAGLEPARAQAPAGFQNQCLAIRRNPPSYGIVLHFYSITKLTFIQAQFIC